MADKIPDYLYNVPSQQHYFDETTSTVASARVYVDGQVGGDYGVVDPDTFIDEPDPVTP